MGNGSQLKGLEQKWLIRIITSNRGKAIYIFLRLNGDWSRCYFSHNIVEMLTNLQIYKALKFSPYDITAFLITKVKGRGKGDPTQAVRSKGEFR